MSATTAVAFSRTVTSAVGAQSNGTRVHSSGFPISVQISAPTSEGRLEVSNDGYTWAAATYNNGTALTGVGSGLYAVDGNPIWCRPCTEADAAGPASFEFLFSIYKEQ